MKIQIIIGSTRPIRIGKDVTDWILNLLPKNTQVDYETIDLAEIDLPMFNEPMHPAMSQYKYEHTKSWSKRISEADAYIFVSPEYNAGYPAVLKNAIDYLYNEWTAKPVMVVSYGFGGGKSANAQLRQVAERLKMRPTELNPTLNITKEMLDDSGQLKSISESFEPYEDNLRAAAEELVDALKDFQ